MAVFEGARAARDARLYMSSLPEGARGFILLTTSGFHSSDLLNFRRVADNGLEIVDAHRGQWVTEMNAPKIVVMVAHERSWNEPTGGSIAEGVDTETTGTIE
jgi:hypothetical protein